MERIEGVPTRHPGLGATFKILCLNSRRPLNDKSNTPLSIQLIQVKEANTKVQFGVGGEKEVDRLLHNFDKFSRKLNASSMERQSHCTK